MPERVHLDPLNRRGAARQWCESLVWEVGIHGHKGADRSRSHIPVPPVVGTVGGDPAGHPSMGGPSSVRDVLALQRTAGNAATVAGLAASALGAPNGTATLQRQITPPPEVSPADRERQLYAATTMRNVPPLDPAMRANLVTTIKYTPVFDSIEERNRVRADVQKHEAELEKANNELSIAKQGAKDVSGAPGGTGPGSGEPEKAQNRLKLANAEVARLSRVVESLGKDLKAKDVIVKKGLADIGVKSEDEVVNFVNETFPKTFIARGKQIAITQLDANRSAAEKERARYRTQTGSDRGALKDAARDIERRTKEIADVRSTRKSTLPPGGADQSDPAVRELAEIEEKVRPKQDELDKKTAEYKLKFPILFKVEPHRIAETPDKDLDALLDGPVAGVLKNIETTRKNIESETLKIWKLQGKGANIAQLTKADMGIEPGSTLDKIIDKKAADDKTTGEMVVEALNALSMVADTIALVSGPVGVAVAAGIAGVAAVANVIVEYQQYQAQQAAGGVAIDPDAAKMATEEPDLSGLIFALASLGIAALGARGAIRAAVQEYKAAKAAATDLDTFKKAITAKIPDPKVREKLIDEAVGFFASALVELVDDEAAWNMLVDQLPDGEAQAEKVVLDPRAAAGGATVARTVQRQNWGKEFEAHVERQLIAGTLDAKLPPMSFVLPGAYKSDNGIDRIGVKVHPDGRVEVFHFEMKWRNPPTINPKTGVLNPQARVGLTQGGQFGTQGGGKWTANAVEQLCEHPGAAGVREHLRATLAMAQRKPVSKVTVDDVKAFLRAHVKAELVVVVPPHVNLKKLWRQIGGLIRSGRKARVVPSSVP